MMSGGQNGTGCKLMYEEPKGCYRCHVPMDSECGKHHVVIYSCRLCGLIVEGVLQPLPEWDEFPL